MRNLLQTVRDAEKNKTAIGHFNVSNLEQLKAVANAAQKLNLPVIVGVSEGEREYIGLPQIVSLVKSYRAQGIEIYLNADHTRSLESVKKAACADFDSIIFDAANLSPEENIKKTAEAVKIIRKHSSWRHPICAEGELGYIGTSSELFDALPEGASVTDENMTTPEAAIEFVKRTKVHFFAPAVGNVHGMFRNAPNPRLNIGRTREIKSAVKIPLVLHGGSGIVDEDFRAAISAGISIIHISTQLRVAWRKSLEQALKENPNETAPYKLMPQVIAAVQEVVEQRLRLFSKLDG